MSVNSTVSLQQQARSLYKTLNCVEAENVPCEILTMSRNQWSLFHGQALSEILSWQFLGCKGQLCLETTCILLPQDISQQKSWAMQVLYTYKWLMRYECIFIICKGFRETACNVAILESWQTFLIVKSTDTCTQFTAQCEDKEAVCIVIITVALTGLQTP